MSQLWCFERAAHQVESPLPKRQCRLGLGDGNTWDMPSPALPPVYIVVDDIDDMGGAEPGPLPRVKQELEPETVSVA